MASMFPGGELPAGGFPAIRPDPVRQAELKRQFRRRLIPMSAVIVLLIASAVLPHVGIKGAESAGRSLLPVSQFFVSAQAGAEGFAGADRGTLALGLDVTYLGLALQQLGLVCAIASTWMMAAEDVGRWLRRLLLVAGWLIAASAALVLTGWQLIMSSGVPAYMGFAWAPALIAGLLMVLSARAAKQRLVGTWYWSRPEWL